MARGRLLHYSEQPLSGPIRSAAQSEEQGAYLKPCGLWVSVEGENDWPWWCKAEDFQTEHLACATVIILAEDAHILWIESEEEIDAFTHRFGFHPIIGKRYESRSLAIHWHQVAGEYQGVIIAPYIWSRRLHSVSSWYYGWDCASGCIWDASAIAEVRTVPVTELAEAAQ